MSEQQRTRQGRPRVAAEADASTQLQAKAPRARQSQNTSSQDEVEQRSPLATGLRTFALMVGGMNLFAMLFQMGSELTTANPIWDTRDWWREMVEGIVQILLAGFVYVAAGHPGTQPKHNLILGAQLYIFTAGISTYYDAYFLTPDPYPVSPSWLCLLVLVYALLVPASLRYHSMLGATASLSVPLVSVGFWLGGRYGDRSFGTMLEAAMAISAPTWVCVGVAMLVVLQQNRREAKIEAMRQDLEQLGSYTLEAKLGAGGMGEVWRASHAFLARPAAIKIIRPEVLEGDVHAAPAASEGASVALARFEKEAQVTASLTSPHTVSLYDFGIASDGTFYYVMELLDGLDMETLVREFGPQPQERVQHVLLQACDSLGEAHAVGLIHRDIKPANVFLCRQGQQFDVVKILDFGLVLDHGEEHRPAIEALRSAGESREMPRVAMGRLTEHGMVQGTPASMAPEQAMGSWALDHRADIYALGCLAYFALTGSDVFTNDEVMQTLYQHVYDPPQPLRERCPQLEFDPRFEALILACLAKDPNDRPRSADDLAEKLRALQLPRRWDRDRARSFYEAASRAPRQRDPEDSVRTIPRAPATQ